MLRIGVSDVWDGKTFERFAALLVPVHAELVARLGPKPGERWLDLGTGAGAIAFRAARAGAAVTAIDTTAPIVEKARADAREQGLEIRFDIGNAELLPYEDACFNVVASSFGFVSAPDHASVASELARVGCAGSRLGFTAWKPNPKLGDLYRRFTDEPLEGREATEWGRESHVEDMLGEDFELEFHDGTVWLEAGSGEEMWNAFAVASAPVRALLARLDQNKREEFQRAFVDLYESYRDGDRVRAPRRYLLTVGSRR
jgi:SAM-dependent methyltransferase